MCANVGHPPRGLVTASFDIRPVRMEDINDERSPGYYYRDIKTSVVVMVNMSEYGKNIADTVSFRIANCLKAVAK